MVLEELDVYMSGKQNNVLERCPCPDPKAYEHATLNDKRGFADVIENFDTNTLSR